MGNPHNKEVAPVRRLESVRQVGGRIGRGASWIWAAVRRGEFPAPVRFSSRCTRWDSFSVDKWIDEQFAEAEK
jgi:prophage regulatory protein